MKLRNIDVVIAIFESYLYIRKNTWKLDSKDLTKAPSDPVAADKFNFCHSIITDIQTANTRDDYVKLLHKLAAKETLEAESVKKNWFRPLDLFGFVYEPPLLLETARAVRAYLISQLREQKEFSDFILGLKSEIASLNETQKSLEASGKKLGEISVAQKASLQSQLSDLNGLERSVCDEYHLKITLLKDDRAKKLSESSFKDFEQNAVSAKRKVDQALLVNPQSSDKKETPVTPVASSTDAKSSAQPEVTPVAVTAVGIEQMTDVISSRSSLSPRNTGVAAASTSAPFRVASIGSTAFAIQTWASRLGAKAKDSSDKDIKTSQAQDVSAPVSISATQAVSASGLSPAAQAVFDKAPLIKVASPPSSPIAIPKRVTVRRPHPPKKHQGRPTLNFEPEHPSVGLKFKPY